MTPEELDEIEAIYERATPGLWQPSPPQKDAYLYDTNGDGVAFCERSDGKGRENAAFIANARLRIPALLAEVRRVQEELVIHPHTSAEVNLMLLPLDKVVDATLDYLRAEEFSHDETVIVDARRVLKKALAALDLEER